MKSPRDQLFTPQRCGIMLCIGWVVLTFLSSSFAHGVAAIDRPVLLVTLLLIFLSVIHLHAVSLLRSSETPPMSLRTIVGLAFAMRLIVVFSTPIQELDYYRYIWDGETVLVGANPYLITPAQVLMASDGNSTVPDKMGSLVEICRQRPRVHATAERVHYGDLPSIYPPVSLAVFAMATAVTPDGVSIDTAVAILRIFIVAFDIGIIFLLLTLLRHVGWSQGLVISYAWCPLVVKEFAKSGHLDAIAVFFMLASIVLLVVHVFPSAVACSDSATIDTSTKRARSRLLLSAGLLGLAIGAKLFPVILMPLMAGLVLRKIGLAVAFSWLAASGLVSVVCCWPMIDRGISDSTQDAAVTATMSDSAVEAFDEQALTGSHRSTQDDATAEPIAYSHKPPPLPDSDGTFSSGDASGIPSGRGRGDPKNPVDRPGHPSTRNSLKVFLSSWKMNDLIFLLLESNLTPQTGPSHGNDHWFIFLPNSVRQSISRAAADKLGIAPELAPFLVSRGILSVVFLSLALRWAWRGMSLESPADWLGSAFSTLAWFWALSPTLNPWYWTWALPLVLFARHRSWNLVSALVLVYYLRFWFAYQWNAQSVLGTRYVGESFFHYVIVWAEHLPWMLLLAWECSNRKRFCKGSELRREK